MSETMTREEALGPLTATVPDRAWMVQKTQLGVETVPGTAVAATKSLQSTTIDTTVEVAVQDFTPLGTKYPTVAIEQKEWVSAPITGVPSYNELAYWLSSLLQTTSVTQVMDGNLATPAYQWVFDSNVNASDSFTSFTIEQGDAVRAQRFAYTMVHELGLKFNKATVDLTGNVVAQRLQDGITLTPSGVTAIPLVPIATGAIDVTIDPTFAALGTTKLGRLFDGTFTLNGKWGPIWVVDSAQTSWAGIVETKPALTFTMIVEADANGMAYLNTLRNGTTVFCRIRASTVPPTGTYTNQPVASAPRTDAGATWTTTTTLTDASLVASDVGRAVTGLVPGIPAATTLTAVTPGVSGIMNHPATVAGSGAVIGTAIPYAMVLDLALKVNHVGKFSDQEGVYAVEFGFTGVADSGWGKALHWTLTNTLATL